ncbi:12459_t:CDS:2 [Dentiscutata heterogama]|uniref:12459_t:CDS:1 n=1 Tax=Dentiscutata heterogama TaxID=1316150 RepID=A0ACA9KPS2_9GLOM|nr:12459_t:CDS:2 [Dentiscutata heterogama]
MNEDTLELAQAVVIPLAIFIPLFREITDITNDIIELYKTAHTNKRICGVLLDRVQATEAAVKNLILREKEKSEFFTGPNNVIIRKLVCIMKKIKEFIKEISELKGLRKYLVSKGVEERFKELTNEFDGYIFNLNFTITIELRAQIEKDNDVLRVDQEETNQLLFQLAESINFNQKKVDSDISYIKEDVVSVKKDVAVIKNQFILMVKCFEEFAIIKERAKNIADASLNILDFTPTSETRGKVRKWTRKSDDYDVAFKEMDESLLKNLNREVGLLKMLQESRDVIQFFGLVEDKHHSTLYLVTEWAQHGNLREYYKKQKLDQSSKIQIALDIVRGLNFLEAYQILHHDIRSANIMIGTYGNAKIANFGMSRGFIDTSRNIKSTSNTIRYMAPEKIRGMPYDSRCEVFSFGMLLWEIAEMELPFSEYKHEYDIRNKILEDPIQLSFKNDMPIKWKKLVLKATNCNPDKRPQFKKILAKLKDLNQTPVTSTDQNVSSQKKAYIKNIMSIEDAIKQHNKMDGDKAKAWESFEFYSQLGDATAKYYKAYYLYKNFLESPCSKEQRLNQAAKLFKEAADDGDITISQYYYAVCLYHGLGVEKDLKSAYEYFCKAAHKGDANSMFNIGNMYYEGVGVEKNVEEGIHWIKMAAYNDLASAVKLCEEKSIPL